MLTEQQLQERIACLENTRRSLFLATVEGSQNSFELAKAYYRFGEILEENDQALRAIEYYVKSSEIACYKPASDKLEVHRQMNLFGLNPSRDELKQFESQVASTPPDILFLLWYQYHTGIGGINKDDGKALICLIKSAERGYAPAQYHLGWIAEHNDRRSLSYDNGFEPRYTRVAELYRLAAEQGYAPAQYAYGEACCCGLNYGLKSDIEESLRWYRLAAEQGYRRAQFKLASEYHHDVYIEQDIPQAVKWYRLAAVQGCKWSLDSLMLLYKRGADLLETSEEAAYQYRQDYCLGVKEALIPLRRCGQTFPGRYHLAMATGREIDVVIRERPNEFVELLLEDSFMTNDERLTLLKKVYTMIFPPAKGFTIFARREGRIALNSNNLGKVCYILAESIYLNFNSDQKVLEEAMRLYRQVPNDSEKYGAAQSDLARIYYFLVQEEQSQICMQAAAQAGNEEMLCAIRMPNGFASTNSDGA